MLAILLLIVISIVFTYYYHKRCRAYEFWKQRGVPTLEARPHWFFGNFGPTICGQKSFVVAYSEAHAELKRRGHKLGGLYLMQIPMLLVVDNELMKRMLQTDFEAFADRGITVDAVANPLSTHLFSLDGEDWQKIRRKLSPTFTSGKMKLMFPIVEQHVDVLIKVTRNLLGAGDDIEYRGWLDRTGVDIIGHVAFGVDCNTLESENKYFYEMSQRITRPKMWKTIKMLFNMTNPANIVALLSSDEEMSNFFIKLIEETVEYRRCNNVKANDFLQLLIEMLEREECEAGSGLTMQEIAAQAFVFFLAGFETTSRTVDFALYALAKAQDEQTLLRKSIQKELDAHEGKFHYEWVMANERLDMVIKETLRLYSPVISLNRVATRDYHVDDLNITIPQGTCVVFSCFGFHRDPDYFDDPLEFRPERFSKANASQIPPFTNIPFGEGPRFCIGKRFGYMQSKMVLAKLLMNFEVFPGEKTVYPLSISPLTTNLMMASEKPLLFKFKPL